MFGLFIPIGIMVDFAEKIDKFRENEVPGDLIISYYIDFIWYFGSQLYPVFLFLAVIFFTSRLANNTEITCYLIFWSFFSKIHYTIFYLSIHNCFICSFFWNVYCA
jgi:lipopolysaccharide export system permease protein